MCMWSVSSGVGGAEGEVGGGVIVGWVYWVSASRVGT